MSTALLEVPQTPHGAPPETVTWPHPPPSQSNTTDLSQVGPLTKFYSVCFFFKKITYYFEVQINDHLILRDNVFQHSLQQLPPLNLGPLKGFFMLTLGTLWHSTSPRGSCLALGTSENPGHCQVCRARRKGFTTPFKTSDAKLAFLFIKKPSTFNSEPWLEKASKIELSEWPYLIWTRGDVLKHGGLQGQAWTQQSSGRWRWRGRPWR